MAGALPTAAQAVSVARTARASASRPMPVPPAPVRAPLRASCLAVLLALLAGVAVAQQVAPSPPPPLVAPSPGAAPEPGGALPAMPQDPALPLPPAAPGQSAAEEANPSPLIESPGQPAAPVPAEAVGAAAGPADPLVPAEVPGQAAPAGAQDAPALPEAAGDGAPAAGVPAGAPPADTPPAPATGPAADPGDGAPAVGGGEAGGAVPSAPDDPAGGAAPALLGAPADSAPGAAGLADAGLADSGALPAAEAGESTDLRIIVLRAHPVVQGTMALLAAMVVMVVTIFLFKLVELAVSGRRLRRGFRQLAQARSLAEGALPGTPSRGPSGRSSGRAPEPCAALLLAVDDELATLPAAIGTVEAEGLHERLEIAFERIETAAIARLRAGTGALPQIASTAPFIGLFGTVFGIMNAFLAIAQTNTTSLAVVAPGIAEALLATAIGLAAAIPAVIVHNLLQRRIGAFRRRLGDAAALAARLVSHEVTGRRLAGRRLGLE